VHFVIKMPDRVKYIPHMMKLLHLRYTWHYKKRYNYRGSLWCGRYTNDLIDNDRYMLACGLYIEHNPVKAKMVERAEDYRWSSCRHWAGSKDNGLLHEHPLEDEMRNYSEIAGEGLY